MPVFLILALMLLITLMRVFMPMGAKKRGKVTDKFSLSLVEKFLFQRTNLYSIGALLALLTVSGTMPGGLQFLVLLVVQAMLLIPVKFVCTTEGVAINNVVFRPWSDFVGYTVGRRRMSLIGREGTRPLNIPILATHQTDVLAALGRRLPEITVRKEAGAETRVTVG
jgi:hypothetical protein